jgi:hypothetical protein
VQVGFKAMAYVMLHGEATLDLLEIAPRELQFRQVPGLAGDFLQLQGKFMLVSDDPPLEVGSISCRGMLLVSLHHCLACTPLAVVRQAGRHVGAAAEAAADAGAVVPLIQLLMVCHRWLLRG